MASVKVVCPYTPEKLRPETVEALRQWAPHAIMVNVAGSNFAYTTEFEKLWTAGEDFVIVEHDIVLHEHVIHDFMDCREPWCANPYRVGYDNLTSLGCVRFRAELLAGEPDAPYVHGVMGPGLEPARDWRRLDTRIMGVLHERGYWPCEHQPPVVHHHDYP
jgi:hypothetical protein